LMARPEPTTINPLGLFWLFLANTPHKQPATTSKQQAASKQQPAA